MMIAGIGLIGSGSIWGFPAVAAGIGGFFLSDSLEFDVEFLGGVILLLFAIGIVYAIGRSVILWACF
jgi:hypothetical protein